MQRLVTRIGNDPAVPTEFDMDFVFGLDKGTFDGLQRIFNNLCDLTDILGDDYDLGHLRELVEADRDGRCKVFKSKIGDTVYVVGESKIVEATILSATKIAKGVRFTRGKRIGKVNGGVTVNTETEQLPRRISEKPYFSPVKLRSVR